MKTHSTDEFRRFTMLDLYCCAGGSGRGYHDAGFEVIGVDIVSQPHYPFAFYRYDAIDLMDELLRGRAVCGFLLEDIDAIHASPPCQRGSLMSNCRPGLAATYPQLVDETRELLTRTGKPYVIEQPQHGTPLRDPVMLCGTMFGRQLYRHRMFESNVPLTVPDHPKHVIPASKAGHWRPGTIISVAGHCTPIALAREVMAIDWMTRDELAEAIPPYYAEHVGRQVIDYLSSGPASGPCAKL